MSALSAASLALYGIASLKRPRFLTTRNYVEEGHESVEPAATSGLDADFKSHVQALGGSTIFAFKALRLFGCIILAALTLVTLLLKESFGTNDYWTLAQVSKQLALSPAIFRVVEWTQLALFLTYVRSPAFQMLLVTSYVSLLGLHSFLVATYCHRPTALGDTC